MKKYLVIILFSVICLTAACGGKKSPTNESTDTEINDTNSSDTKELDSASDSDETDTDTSIWKWENLPTDEENCGKGCKRVTFSAEVESTEWDIWEDKLVYRADVINKIVVVDLKTNKQLVLPDFHKEYPTSGDSVVVQKSPTIYKNKVYYSLGVFHDYFFQHEIIEVDLEAQTQTLVWTREIKDKYKEASALETYGDRLVCTGGAGEPTVRALSAFEPPWPSAGIPLIDSSSAGDLSLWENILVFWDLRKDKDDPISGYSPGKITGYDFEKKAFFPVVDDGEYQAGSRIHKKRVVYMDFRFGEDTSPFESWSNSAIYMKRRQDFMKYAG